jgi:AAA15 family ATPase/GTPase
MSNEVHDSSFIYGLNVEDFIQNGFNKENRIWDIFNLKPINFFIGENNSGKSRLLRTILTSKNNSTAIKDLDPATLLEKIYRETTIDSFQLHEFNSSLYQEAHVLLISKAKELTMHNLLTNIKNEMSNVYHRSRSSLNTTQFDHFSHEFFKRYIDIENFEKIINIDFSQFEKVYIPLLRGLRPLDKESDRYQERTINDYFKSNSNSAKYSIFTGHSIYNEIKNSLLGSHENRVRVREFEKYLSSNFFNNNEITLIPRINEDVVYLKEGNKQERRISDLGDGLQSIIILTFKVFMAEKPTAFFIEEAEQHLHAGMQRALINAYAQHAEHMYFITTHSNHFVDISQELECISLQRVYQKLEGSIECSYIDSLSDKSEMLADLGVRASSVLLANCSLWVEGITDKLYLATFMNKYLTDLDDHYKVFKLKNYKENLHYIFTEYQGSNITHWDFSNNQESVNSQTKAKSLTSNILLIADNDIEGKADRAAVLRRDLKENFLLLDFKEIENHIPAIIVEKTANTRWKTFNQKDDATFEILNLEQTELHTQEGIGSILESYVKNNTTERIFFKEKSGTIKDKVKFCHTAISIMNDPDTNWELTPELKIYCKHIWEHIEKCNPK